MSIKCYRCSICLSAETYISTCSVAVQMRKLIIKTVFARKCQQKDWVMVMYCTEHRYVDCGPSPMLVVDCTQDITRWGYFVAFFVQCGLDINDYYHSTTLCYFIQPFIFHLDMFCVCVVITSVIISVYCCYCGT